MKKMSVVSMVIATNIKLQCPNCSKWIDDFLFPDVRGEILSCPYCDSDFLVSLDADVDFN